MLNIFEDYIFGRVLDRLIVKQGKGALTTLLQPAARDHSHTIWLKRAKAYLPLSGFSSTLPPSLPIPIKKKKLELSLS